MHVSSDEKEQNPEPSFKGAYEVFSAYYLMIHAQFCCICAPVLLDVVNTIFSIPLSFYIC